jgi:hypothetical protein
MKFRILSVVALALAIMSAQAVNAESTKVIKPFNGTNLDGWKIRDAGAQSFWTVGEAKINPDNPKTLVATPSEPGEGSLINDVQGDWTDWTQSSARGIDLSSDEKFGDCTLDLEFMVSKDSNSGIYMMGEYEVQVLDSFGHEKMGPGDVGALYGAAPPKVNASTAPGTWQHFVIEFIAPKFDEDGKKIANAKFVKITLNGKVVQEDVEMEGPTPSGLTGKEAATGPIMFQGNHGSVALRNIKVIVPAE